MLTRALKEDFDELAPFAIELFNRIVPTVFESAFISPLVKEP